MKLQEVLQRIQAIQIKGEGNPDILDISFDSRQVGAGHLFVAIKGVSSDGHAFIPMAIEKGAVAIICEEIPADSNAIYIQVKDASEALAFAAAAWYDFPSADLQLIGVTGTNGKTTTATLLYEMFRAFGHKSGLLSTVCNYVDDEAVPATHTTPNPMELNALLRRMVAAGCEYAFMEVSSHSVVQKRIAALEFDGGIFTNITRDHIDYHETFENYLAAKKGFFDSLSKDAFALTNVDDKNGMVMLQNTKADKKTYSARTLADFKVKILETGFEGMLLTINDKEVAVPFIGKFNAYNLLAVYGTAILLGKEDIEVLRVLSTLHSVSGRFEALRSPKGYTAIVDYAHTPDALNNVLSTINDIRDGQGSLITIVGCGGDRDKGKRPMMAKESTNASSKVIITSDNPRTEEPQAIIDDMLAGLDANDMRKALTIIDREQAIKTACMLAQAGDVVLVAGKGHEDYQIIGTTKHHFDDREVLRAIFETEK